MSGPRKRPLSDTQRLCLDGLPVDGSWVHRGGRYTSYQALMEHGLVKRRYEPKGSKFYYARVT